MLQFSFTWTLQFKPSVSKELRFISTEFKGKAKDL
jgi:hypothetical protein